MFWLLAWRNLWRNARRTLVILLAVVVGVWAMVLSGALMRGGVQQMMHNAIATLTGHLQVHQKGFRSDPGVEHRLSDPAALETLLKKSLPAGSHWALRVRVGAFVQNARHSAGVTLVGIEPAAEARVSFIARAVKQGRYLKPGERRGIVVGRALMKKFGSRLGRKLVLMSQDASGRIASRAFRIVGVYGAEMEGTEKQFVFVSKSAAQAMLKLGRAVSEAAVMLPSRELVARTAAALQASLPPSQTVSTWRELLPLVTINLDMFEGWIWLWFVLVFVAMGFGIVNTILMAIFERVREFGLMKALGMKPLWIVKGVLAEALVLLCLGMAAGNLLSLASIWLLSITGIDLSSLAAGTEFAGMTRMIYPHLAAKEVIMANAVVLGLGLIISLYPAFKAARFTPVQALAHT